MSSNSSLDLGSKIVLIFITFSCRIILNILSSLRVLLVNILCSKAFSIFLIAIRLSCACLSIAATTMP